jgi:hypothetical protein
MRGLDPRIQFSSRASCSGWPGLRPAMRVVVLRFKQQAASFVPRIHAGEVRGKRALRNATVFVSGSSFEEPVVSQRSASAFFPQGFRTALPRPGGLLAKSPQRLWSTEILKRRRFCLRTGVLHSSHSRQRLIVAADGDPKPPQIAAANRDRRRRPFPATRTPLDAPSMETAKRTIFLVRVDVKNSLGRKQKRRASPPGAH